MKFKLLIVLLMTLTLTACVEGKVGVDVNPNPMENVRTEQHCTSPEERQALAAFIVACSTAANPKADEEGEDLVLQCDNSGTNAICPTHYHRWHAENGTRTYYDELGEVVSQVKPAVVKPASNHVFFSTDEKGNIVNPRKLDANGKLVPASEFKDKS